MIGETDFIFYHANIRWQLKYTGPSAPMYHILLPGESLWLDPAIGNMSSVSVRGTADMFLERQCQPSKI